MTKKFKIETPAKDYTGVSFGIAFNAGVGETSDAWLVQRFKESGYKVSEIGGGDETEAPIPDTDLTGLSYAELKEKAAALGLEFSGNIKADDLKGLLREAGYEA